MANRKDLEEINKLIKEVETNYRKLSQAPPVFNKDKVTVKELNEALELTELYLDDIQNSAQDLYESFRAVTEEVSRGNDSYTKAKSSLNSMTSITGKLRDHQSGINKLSSKELSSLKSKYSSQQDNLKTSGDLLQNKKANEGLDDNEAIMLENINGLLDDKASTLQETLRLLDAEEKKRKKIEKSLGATGALMKGLAKIPILGDAIDTKEILEEMESTLGKTGDKLGKTGSKTKAFGAGLKMAGKQMVAGLLNPANLLLGALTFMVKTLIGIDKLSGDFAKNQNTSYEESLKTRMEFARIANLSGDQALNSERLMKTQMEISGILGSNAMLNEADLKTMTKLTNQAGFTAKELGGIQKLSLINNKTLEDNTKEILGSAQAYSAKNKIALNEKDILREVNNASASLKLSLGGSVKELTKAVVQAKKFGLNLEQAEKISSSLLDFESSIESELSAELLLGKDLNFERARGLALNGKTTEAAEEIAKQMGSSAEFGRLNVIQQEALAKAAGVSKNELAQSLIDKEAVLKMGQKEGTALEAYNKLKKEGLSTEQIGEQLGDEALARQYEQQSVSEKIAESVGKFKEIFVTMAPALETVASLLGTIFDVVGLILTPVQMLFDAFSYLGGFISNALGPLKEMGPIARGLVKVLKGVASMAVLFAAYKTFGAVATGMASMGPLALAAPFVAGAAAAAITAAGFGLIASIKDGMISPKGGLMVSGEKGSIQLDKEDSIIAGTSLLGNKKSNPTTNTTSNTTQSVNVDMTQTNTLLQQLINVISAGGDVTLDGQKVGEALNLVSYKTQ